MPGFTGFGSLVSLWIKALLDRRSQEYLNYIPSHTRPTRQIIDYDCPMKSIANSRSSRLGRWAFFRQWLKNPLRVAAISPSSAHLARQMIAELPVHSRKIIELGGGTGAITQVLLEHGVSAEQLLVVELNEELHQHLQARFPDVQIELGNATQLVSIARSAGFLDDGKVDAIISGLGLLSMPKELQKEILEAAFECLTPEGRFIQFTYGPANPVSNEVIKEMDLTGRRAGFTWLNMPPATVFVYRRRLSTAVPARSMR